MRFSIAFPWSQVMPEDRGARGSLCGGLDVTMEGEMKRETISTCPNCSVSARGRRE